MKSPLVSIIITTKNEEKNIGACLSAITKQNYKNTEILVIDNSSTDKTQEIAKKYTRLVFTKGNERSSQRNFGVSKAKGMYVLILDADMLLTKTVIEECIKEIVAKKTGGIIIPEESFGNGFWAQCKKLERSFYLGNDFMEAGRFFDRKIFIKSGGFDESLTGPEDWDLSQRIKMQYGLSRIKSKILHNEGNLSLWKTMKKKYYYSQKFKGYVQKKENSKYTTQQFGIITRYKIFFTHPVKLFKNPVLGIGMLFMKTCEFISGGIGYIKN